MNIKRLLDIIGSGLYDVVIAHSSHAFDYLRVVYPFLRRKPKVVALRRSGYIPGLLSKRFKYSIADRIVVVSEKVAHKLREAGFYPDRLRVIQSGIDLSRFYPRPELYKVVREDLGVREDELLLMQVANWQPWRKGQEVLLEALSNLPFRNFKMVFIGLNTNSEEARETFRKFGLGDRCLGLGFRRDVDILLQGADVFVLSSFSEGIAGALLQAMACGKVVVSTDAGGIPEYLKDSINGFMVPVGDSKALRSAIRRAVELPDTERRKIITEAIETAKEYSIDRTVDRYIELIEELSGA
jgi:glycosyltransferase involved in cell wall biosynthesis